MNTDSQNTQRRFWIANWPMLLLIATLCGCFSVDSEGRKFAIRDPLPEGSAKGFADFSLSPNSEFGEVAVRRVGDGLFGGADIVQITSRGSSLLRIAAPPGEQRFFVARTVITVPISQGMVTPVELNTRRAGNSIWKEENCQVTFRISAPTACTPLR